MGYPNRTGTKAAPNIVAQDEYLGALLGDRGKGDPGLAAVKRGDAAGAGLIALQAKTVTAAPTAAEHNALVNDMRAIAGVLARMGGRFTGL